MNPIQKLTGAAGEFSPRTQRDFSKNQVKATPTTKVVRADAAGKSGQQIFVDETVSKRQGASSFHQGYLPEGRNFAFNRVRVAQSTDQSQTDSADVVDYSPIVTDMAAALRNGKLTIEEDNKIVFEQEIVSLGCEALSEGNVGQFDGFLLDDPIVLHEQKRIRIYIDYADGATMTATNNLHVEILLIGAETRTR